MRAWIQLAALVRKEYRQTLRDPRMVWMLIAVPVIQLTLFGFAVNLEVDRLPTVLCDEDRTPTSRDLASHFFADRTFVMKAEVDSASEGATWLERNRAAVVLVLPRGLEQDLARGRPTNVQVLVDGTDPVRGRVAMATSEQFFLSRGLSLGLARAEMLAAGQGSQLRLSRVVLEPRLYYNPELRSPFFMVPGVVASVLLIVTTLVTAMGIAREREMGTLEQVMVTPVPTGVYLFGKILPFMLIGLIDVGLVVGAGVAIFDVPVRGSMAVIYAGALLYILSTLGVGLFVSTLARTQQQAILGGAFFLLPAIMLGGFMSPVDSMPEWIRTLAYIDPVYYFTHLLRAVMLKGAGFADVARELLALAAIGGSVFVFSVLRFHRRTG